jgi:hypothetical protein
MFFLKHWTGLQKEGGNAELIKGAEINQLHWRCIRGLLLLDHGGLKLTYRLTMMQMRVEKLKVGALNSCDISINMLVYVKMLVSWCHSSFGSAVGCCSVV